LSACGAPSTIPEIETSPTGQTTPEPETIVPEAETPSTPPPSERQTYTLRMSIFPSGAGVVSPSGGEYEPGTQLTLTATPASGYTFDHWSDDISGSSATTTITLDSNKHVNAVFGLIMHTLQVSINGDGTTSPVVGSHSYPDGAVVDLLAIPNEGWEFLTWSGDIQSYSPTITIRMGSSKSVTARFRDATPPLISGVEVSEITDCSATVVWQTDEPATTELVYGSGTKYETTGLTTRHTATADNLESSTTCHFYVVSKDEAGNEAVSDDYTFTTKTAEELLSAMLYSGITIGGRVHQLCFNLFNGSSQTITLTKVEILDEHGAVSFTMSKSDITETWGSGEVGVGKSLSASISFGIPPSTTEVEDWQVKWYCLDINGVKFIVTRWRE